MFTKQLLWCLLSLSLTSCSCTRENGIATADISVDSPAILSDRQNAIISAVVSDLCRNLKASHASLDRVTLAGNDIHIRNNTQIRDVIEDRFGIDFQRFCRVVSRKQINVATINTLTASVSHSHETPPGVLPIEISLSEPAFGSDSNAFLYVTAFNGHFKSGAEMFYSVIREDNEWKIQRSITIGIGCSPGVSKGGG